MMRLFDGKAEKHQAQTEYLSLFHCRGFTKVVYEPLNVGFTFGVALLIIHRLSSHNKLSQVKCEKDQPRWED
jgi:hypothetical protein